MGQEQGRGRDVHDTTSREGRLTPVYNDMGPVPVNRCSVAVVTPNTAANAVQSPRTVKHCSRTCAGVNRGSVRER